MLESKTLRKRTKLSPKLNTLSEQCSATLQKNRKSSNTTYSESNYAENNLQQKNSTCLRKNKFKENVKDKFSFNSPQTGSNDLEPESKSEYKAWWEKSENNDGQCDKLKISSHVSSGVKGIIKPNTEIIKHRASLVYPVSSNKYKSIPFTFSIHCGIDEENIQDKSSNETEKRCQAKQIKNMPPNSTMDNNTDKQTKLVDVIYHSRVNEKTFPEKSRKCPSIIDYQNLTDILYSKMSKNQLVHSTTVSDENDKNEFRPSYNKKKNNGIKSSEDNNSKQRSFANKKTGIYFNEKDVEDYKLLSSKTNINSRKNPKVNVINTINTRPQKFYFDSDYPNINDSKKNIKKSEDGVSNYAQKAVLMSNLSDDGSLNMRPDKLSDDITYPSVNSSSVKRNNYRSGVSKQKAELMSNSSNDGSIAIKQSKFSNKFSYPIQNSRSQSINSYKHNDSNQAQGSEFISNASEDSSGLLSKHKYPLWRETENYLMDRKRNLKLKQRNYESESEYIYTKIIESSTCRNIPNHKTNKTITKDMPLEFQSQSNRTKNNEAPPALKANRILSTTEKPSTNKLKPTISNEVTNSEMNYSNEKPPDLTGSRILSPTAKLTSNNVKPSICKKGTNYNLDEDFQSQEYKNDTFYNARSDDTNTNPDKHTRDQFNNGKSDVSPPITSQSRKTFSPYLKRSKTPNEDIVKKDEKPKKKELKPLVHFVNGKNDFKVNTKEKLAKFNLGDAMTYTLYGTNTFTDKKSLTENHSESNRNYHKSQNVVSSPGHDISSQLICTDQINNNRNEIISNIISSPCSPIIQEAESECSNCCKHNNVSTNYPNGFQSSCNGFPNACKHCGYVSPSYQSNSYNFNRINVPIMSKYPPDCFIGQTPISPFVLSRPETAANSIPFTNTPEIPVYFNGFGMIRDVNKYFYPPEVCQIQFPTPTMIPANPPMFVGNISQLPLNNSAFNIAPVYSVSEVKDKSQPLPCITESNSMQKPEKSQDKSSGAVNSFLQSIKEEGRKIARELSSGKNMAVILHGSHLEIKSDKSESNNNKTPLNSNECHQTLNSDSRKGKDNQPTQERKFTGIIPGLY